MDQSPNPTPIRYVAPRPRFGLRSRTGAVALAAVASVLIAAACVGSDADDAPDAGDCYRHRRREAAARRERDG